MTTIAASKAGGFWTLAADSQETREGEDAGDIKRPCQKLFRMKSRRFHPHFRTEREVSEPIIVATAGESGPGLLFLEWLATSHEPPEWLRDHDINCLVLTNDQRLFEFDEFCVPTEIKAKHYAIGTGAMAAEAAMEMGATPERAVEIAAKYDPYTGGPVVSASFYQKE